MSTKLSNEGREENVLAIRLTKFQNLCKTAMFSMCTQYKLALMTQEINVDKVIRRRKGRKCLGHKAYHIPEFMQKEKNDLNPAKGILGSRTQVRAR